jgi:transcriptional regulator with XRE-family HTH domain
MGMTEPTAPTTQGLTLRVAAEVRAEVARQRLTHKRLAELLGLSQPQITKRLNGVIAMNTTELDRIAEALGVPVERLLSAPSVPAGAA